MRGEYYLDRVHRPVRPGNLDTGLEDLTMSQHGGGHQLLPSGGVQHGGPGLIHQRGHVECLPRHHAGGGRHLGNRQRGGVLTGVCLEISPLEGSVSRTSQ